MSFVRTVSGDIAPAELGVCYAHEHLFIGPSYAADQDPDFLLDDVEKGVAELRELKMSGVSACVDSMPCDCGRNAKNLLEMSRQSGVHIIAPTGLHLRKYYDSGHWSHWWNSGRLTRLFVDDINQGIDDNDYGSPEVVRGDAKAGVIKVAAPEVWDARTYNLFIAAAWAHKLTGCPILTHTENGQLAVEQAQFLAEQGADLNHVVLSHLDRNPDSAYHREVLKTGVTIEYDSHFRWKNQSPNPTLELLKTLLPEFPDQIVLGMDAARRSYWKNYGGGPGLSWLYTEFRTQMQNAGISDELIHQVFVATPARVYSFKDKT